MTPLIDADILLFEIGWSGEFKDKDSGEPVLLPPEEVLDLLDKKIEGICRDVDATKPPILFVSDSEYLTAQRNKQRKREGLEPVPFVPNFRYSVAKTQPYKGNRKNPKPFHFYNILAHMMANYDTVVSEDGYEADDMLCMHQIETAKEFGVAIPTHAGPVLVDYEDWLKWGTTTFIVDGNGYVINDTGKGETRKVWSLHREIMGNPEGMHVDHTNGDKMDNRKYNLRVCSAKENIRNSKAQEGTSGYKGVHYDKSRGRWSASIKVDRKSIFLGRYDSENQAAEAYDEAAKEYFGEYARLNFSKPYVKPFKQTIICSRDKDLRICPLWHYSWECGKQGTIWPTETDRIGWLIPEYRPSPKTGKDTLYDVWGYGLSFFYYQMLVGDTADHIPGLPGYGKVAAYNLLKDLKTEEELFKTVREHYKAVKGEESKEYFLEMANLLWMTQEKGVGYKIPKFNA